MKIGSFIKNQIKISQYNQKEVAFKIGISETAMSQICQNVFHPSQKHLDLICDVLCIDIEYKAVKRNES